MEAKPGGRLGLGGLLGQVGIEEDHTLFAPAPRSSTGRVWRLIAKGQAMVGGEKRRWRVT